ncbi:phage tail protein, partial [Raoultella planticola]|nr:phage tail protein [Raoultella planticola]MDM9668870.1 phage tail protein [Raoultella planticola]
MSENNYGALMMKSALSANVDIDSVLQPGIYPVPSGNTSSPDPNGGILTIYPDPSKRRIFASNRFITTPSSYNTLLKQWDEWESLILHSELSDDNGFKLVGQVHSAAALAV